ncbi:hypothetical protein SAMN05216315_11216 [Nitrosospira sp. Nsp18]|nr:hypothetical protein SAMN05216315_11216 [Nitrosospira sp. Nsp18]
MNPPDARHILDLEMTRGNPPNDAKPSAKSRKENPPMGAYSNCDDAGYWYGLYDF